MVTGPMPRKSEGDESEGEDGDGRARAGVEEGFHAGGRAAPACDGVADGHQAGDADAEPERGEVAGDQSAEDIEGSPAFLAGIDDLVDVTAVHAGEDFDQFGDQRTGGGAAGDDGGKFPPKLALAEVGDQEPGKEIGRGDGDDAGEENEHGEGMLEIHLIGVEVFGAGDGIR